MSGHVSGHVSGHRSRPLAVLVSSAVLGLVTGVGAVLLAKGDGDDASRSREVAAHTDGAPYALRVLRAWDARRSRAFARGDAAALAALYVPGSRTGAADRAVLRSYRQRGLSVTGMRTQVLAAEVLRESERRLVLRVTDVLVDAVAADGRELRWPLPHDRPSTRRVVLVDHDGTWRVAEVYAAG
jgi:hypothetical protein